VARSDPPSQNPTVHGGSLTRDESTSSYAVIRHNVRTYESNGVVQVVRGKDSAESTVKQFELSQASEDRHAGWRYFIEKTSTAPGTNPAEATRRREAELDLRERKALEEIDSATKSH
jgi:hypothetical protein